MRNGSNHYRQYGRAIVLGALLGIGLALVFCAGFFLRDVIDMPSVFAAPASESQSYGLLDEVQALLDRHYLREQPDYAQRQYAAVRGLMAAIGDRNTFFNEPVVARSESDVLSGTYGGIGVTVTRSASGEFVLFPFPDGPAANAGIRDNDVLRSVNGAVLTSNESLDAIDQMLRGEVRDGSGVEVTVTRASDETFTTFIAFDVINIPSVMWRVLAEDDRLGYIRIERFTNRTPGELEEAIINLQSSDISALVLDLRNNGGGLLQESVDVASFFLDGGPILYQQTREGESAFEARPEGMATEYPLVVLVNRGTASASELVAGAIQDRERGILIGQTTYGKGTIQQIFTLSDTSSIHVTYAEWFTPNRNAIDGVGLTPNIEMIPDEAGRDIELEEAVRYLREQLATE